MRGLARGLIVLVLASCTPMRSAPAAPDGSAAADAAEAPAAVAAAPAPPAASEVAPPAKPEADSLTVEDVHVDQTANGRRLVIALSRTPDRVRGFALDAPPRAVADVYGPLPHDAGRMAHFKVSDELVTGVRAAGNGKTLRVVVDLRDGKTQPALRQEGALLVADLGDAPVPATPIHDEPAAAAVDEGPVAAAPPPAPAPVEAVSGDADGRLAVLTPVAATIETPPAPPAEEPAPTGPGHVEVQTTPAPLHPKVALPPPSVHYTGQRISLDLKDADIQNVLRVLADVSQLNIIATDDVKGKVTLHLTDVPWDQALDLVLRSNRLEKTQEGNVVRISTVARLKEEREALRAAQDAEKELEPLRVNYVKVNYARADEALIEKVKGVLTDRGSVTFDDRTNTVIVRDIGRGILDASELIRQLDTQSPQVLIEANIVEATEDFARGLGVQWGYQNTQGPQTGNPTGQNFPGTVSLGSSGLGSGSAPPSTGTNTVRLPIPFMADFPVPAGFASGFGAGTGSALDLALGSLDGTHSLAARLTALEEQGKGKVISRPRVITMNNVAATIQSLTILRVKLPSTGTVINTGTGGAAGGATTATEKINTGITLVVTPQVSSDGYVLMSIYAKSSQPDFTHNVDGIPNEVSREANSNVLIPNGETVVLGGIFRNTSNDNESGLPYLRNVPALGWLFKRLLRSSHHEELLVFLTPRIVSGGTAALPGADRLWEERRRGG
jgi:type IV pilus assembly protein PilQ